MPVYNTVCSAFIIGEFLCIEALLAPSEGTTEVRIPVKVCLRVTMPFPDPVPDPVGVLHVAIPIRAEVLLLLPEAVIGPGGMHAEVGVLAGGLVPRLGVLPMAGGGNAGFINVSTFLDTRPFFCVRMAMMEDLLHPGVSSNAN